MISRVILANLVGYALAALLVSTAYAATSSCFGEGRSAPTGDKDGIDVFLVAGQSNATGIPDNADGSPKVPDGIALQYYQGRISTANDPVGNANPGSAWPSFGIAYHAITGRRAMFVPASVPASSMTSAGDFLRAGRWDATGKLFDEATKSADEALKSAGPHARFSGVLWDQGENDGLAINVKFETPADYKTALERLISRFRAHFGETTPFFIFETGAVLTEPPGGLAAVRAAQVDVSKESRANPIVFSDAITFPARKLMARNAAHYTQEGYNIMGREGAAAVAAYYKENERASCEGSGTDH